jgi:prepilin-type N-terminal cleavage/methylation domain-containing protein
MSARREDGFTLPELLVGMIVGLIVVFAAFAILDRAYTANREANERSDSAQRARLTMDKVVQTLRSQVCIGAPRAALTAGDANGVTLLVDLSGGTQVPQRRNIAYSPSTRTLTESIYQGTGTFPSYVFPATPTSTSTLLTNVGQAGTTPVFRYFALDTAGTNGANTELGVGVPLTTAELSRVARISVGFMARPERATVDNFSTTLHDDVFMRSADPANPTGGLSCL